MITEPDQSWNVKSFKIFSGVSDECIEFSFIDISENYDVTFFFDMEDKGEMHFNKLQMIELMNFLKFALSQKGTENV